MQSLLILPMALLYHAVEIESPSTVIPTYAPGKNFLKTYYQVEEDTKRMPVVKDLDWETPEGSSMGLLLAGRAEFNWIVDIRLHQYDQEMWSIGNLVTYYHVMTTCRALKSQIPTRRKADSPQRFQKSDATVDIYFGLTYLFEENFPDSRIEVSGIRHSRLFTLHPSCNIDDLLFDFALIELETGISVLTPIRGYMPVIIDPYSSTEIDLIKNHKMVCHVGAFGRKYRNISPESDIIKDLKIRFRVYFVDLEECKKYFDKICPVEHPACKLSSLTESAEDVMCFRPRKKVGAICDNHRGAPLVCNGFVYGLVTHGVHFENCHTLLQYPVLVVRSNGYVKDLYWQITYGQIKILDTSRSDSFCFYSLPSLIVLTIFMYFHIGY